MDSTNPPVDQEKLAANAAELTDRIHERAEYVKAQHDKVIENMELVKNRASNAARRCLEKRPPDLPIPQTAEELMQLVEKIAERNRFYGVFLADYEKKAITKWHAFVRAMKESKVEA